MATQEHMLEINMAELKTEADVDAIVDKIADMWKNSTDDINVLEKLYGAFETVAYKNPNEDASIRHIPQVACKAGCHWCCHMSVEILPAEVNVLLSTTRQLDPVTQARVRAHVSDIHRQQFTPESRLRKRIPCAFLRDDKTCGVYYARPYTCRGHHSMNVKVCRNDFYEAKSNILNDPHKYQNLEIINARAILLRAALKALKHLGYSTEFVELSTGLHQAFTDRS